MSDIIKLLPDAVANQIAAGEVVQRPASAVKELLENSIDAGATHIKLLIKDGGVTLLQVIDNGKGMSETDARMCWERHATSKIRQATDLFSLNTYGFRGEAMASIAAVAQVELKTKREIDDVATFIRIEGSEIIEQRMDQAPLGTSIAVKNLFYNIPARRNFLKSIAVETKHIYEEFQRQAMACPNIHFQLYNNGQEVFNWNAQPLLQRLAEVLGKKDVTQFLPVEELTDIVNIHGFVGSPNMSKRTRGDQYFFVNDRFIKSPYFHHAVMQAYEGILEADSFPTYVIFLTIAPEKVDVNVHPTKTEVKFEDEKHIYNLIKAAARKALGAHVIQADSEILGLDNIQQFLSPNPASSQQDWMNIQPPSYEKQDKSFNPFNSDRKPYERNNSQDWQKILGPIDHHFEPTFERPTSISTEQAPIFSENSEIQVLGTFTLGERYLVANIEGVLNIIDRKLAIQQVFYNQFFSQLEAHKGTSQQLLFPRNIELAPPQLAVVLEIMDDLKALGFDLGHFGGNSLIVNGLPAQVSNANEQKLLEDVIEDYLNTQGDVKLNKHQSLALSMARKTTQFNQSYTSNDQAKVLIKELLAIPQSQYTFDRKLVYVQISAETIFDLFKRTKSL